jgi:hypothetical protein
LAAHGRYNGNQPAGAFACTDGAAFGPWYPAVDNFLPQAKVVGNDAVAVPSPGGAVSKLPMPDESIIVISHGHAIYCWRLA